MPSHAMPAPQRKKRTTADMLAENKGPGLGVTALRTLLGLVALAAVLLMVFLGARAIEGPDTTPNAPWSSRSAPAIAPAPLADQ